MRLRQVFMLEAAFRKSDARPVARAERQQRQPELISGARLRQFGIGKRRQPRKAVGAEPFDQVVSRRNPDQRPRQKTEQTHAGSIQHCEKHHHQEHSRAEVLPDEYQSHHRSAHQTAYEKEFPRRRLDHFDAVRTPFRKKKRQNNLRVFRRLDIAHPRNLDPAPRSVGRCKHQRDYQQKTDPQHQNPAPVGNPFVAQEQNRPEPGHTDASPHDLFHEVGGSRNSE